MKKTLVYLILATFTLSVCAQSPNKRALRGVWIATVANIDWPTTPGLSVEQQKEEMIFLLDKVKSHNMNTIVFQIRPTGDAFYKSELEPSSHWITGEQGAEIGYDPLQFTIDECNKRGIFIHVWLNPYRINQDTAIYKTYAKNHIVHQHPEWVIPYRNALYFNPALDEVREFTCQVVKDIVSRYDIDAIHIDDAFYPYIMKSPDFPDSLNFVQDPRGFTNKHDWRRDNVNLVIRKISKTIKSIKPWVEFGISPGGIWTTNYNELYADVLLWQKEGWIDYILPQLYFSIDPTNPTDFATQSDWWSKYNYGANVYTGVAPYLVSKTAKRKAWRTSDEIIRQIDRNAKNPNIKGEIYFSAKAIFKNPNVDIEKHLLANEYKALSLAPENNRIARIEPENPLNVSMQINTDNTISFKWERGKNAKRFVIYKFRKNKPFNIENPESIVAVTRLTEAVLSAKNNDLKEYRYGVTSLSPSHTESAIVYFD